MRMADRRFHILLVEDNVGEAQLIEQILPDCQLIGRDCQLKTIVNPREVIPFLRSPEAHGYVPDLVILDYIMPIDGGLTLVELKGDPKFLHIPVVVLTGLRDPLAICDVYRRGANCCYHKPSRLAEWESS